MLTFEEVEKAEVVQTIAFPLIVPTYDEIINSDNLEYLSKSAINACYCKPETIGRDGKPQSWFDVQLTTECREDLPPREKWFYIVSDDGFLFKGRFSGKKIKKLVTFENQKIIGTWLKGKFIDCGFVDDYSFVCQDRNRDGIISKEMLESFGGDTVFLQKTIKTQKDKRGVERDIWFLSFPNYICLEPYPRPQSYQPEQS